MKNGSHFVETLNGGCKGGGIGDGIGDGIIQSKKGGGGGSASLVSV